MKISSALGEYAFRGLIPSESGWVLTDRYYLSEQAFLQDHKVFNYFWPAEVQDNGIIYIPSKEELNEEI